MKQYPAIGVFLFCLALASSLPAITQPDQLVEQQTVTTESRHALNTLVMEGIVKKIDNTTALFTGDRIYPLVGGDFAMIVGKKVHIIGKMIEDGGVEKIEVARVQFERN